MKRNTASVTLGQFAGKAEAANTRKATEQHRTTESLRYSSRNPRGGSFLWTTLNKARYRQAREAEGS